MRNPGRLFADPVALPVTQGGQRSPSRRRYEVFNGCAGHLGAQLRRWSTVTEVAEFREALDNVVLHEV